MPAIEPCAPHTIMGVDLPHDVHDGLRTAAAARPGVNWSYHPRIVDARAAVVRAPADPSVLVVGYTRRQRWSIVVLLCSLFRKSGGSGTRVLLVTDCPRSALPVFLTDDHRVECLAVEDVVPRATELVGGAHIPAEGRA